MENCIIQKSMKNPDLYENKRYKMRVHLFYTIKKYIIVRIILQQLVI